MRLVMRRWSLFGAPLPLALAHASTLVNSPSRPFRSMSDQPSLTG